MTEYDGEVDYEWQHRWDKNLRYMRDEDLTHEKSHLALGLTPVSERMQYGIRLTHDLLTKIKHVSGLHGARFILFRTKEPAGPDSDSDPQTKYFALNGMYYRFSRLTWQNNLSSVNKGITAIPIPITLEAWRRGPDDSHLNEHATDEAMQTLANQLLPQLANISVKTETTRHQEISRYYR